MKHKNLLIILWLVLVWTLFFSIFQYFIWWMYKSEIITLQFIAWYMSFWWIIAYIIWWVIYEILKEKKYHIFIILPLILVIISLFLLKNPNNIIIWIISLLSGFYYWMWMVLRNILVSNEISNSSFSDTKINGFVNIWFTSSIIIWSILWWYLSEVLNIKWAFFIIWLLWIWLLIWLFLEVKYFFSDNKNLFQKLIHFKSDFKLNFLNIWKKYFSIMFIPAIIITLVTILFQKVIEYNVTQLWIALSSATFLLLYSAIWAILWNIITMKLRWSRWIIFSIIISLFSLNIIIFPLFMDNFFYTKVLVFTAWILFWISFNLSESYFLKQLSTEENKSFWSSFYWMTTNIVMWIIMFIIFFLSMYFSYSVIFIIIGICFLVIWFMPLLKFKKERL